MELDGLHGKCSKGTMRAKGVVRSSRRNEYPPILESVGVRQDNNSVAKNKRVEWIPPQERKNLSECIAYIDCRN